MASSSSSSSSSSYSSLSLTHGWRYHVFISFRGIDTRLSFAGYLYDALCRSGIKTFFDDEELEKGDEINDTLNKAIRDSMIGLIIFSKNYASSTWCLEELTKIMEYSKDESKRMYVVPVFYLIDPSDLRHHKGSYGEALYKHEERLIEKRKIQKWREALNNVAGLSGWHLKPGVTYEHKFINKIVESVYKKISKLLYSDQNAAASPAQHDYSQSMIQSQQGQPNNVTAGYTIPSPNVGVSSYQSQQRQDYPQLPTQQLSQPIYRNSFSYQSNVPPQSEQSVPNLSNDLSSLAVSGATPHSAYTSSRRQYHQPVQQPSSQKTSAPKPFEHPIPMHRRKKANPPQSNNIVTNQGEEGAQHLPNDPVGNQSHPVLQSQEGQPFGATSDFTPPPPPPPPSSSSSNDDSRMKSANLLDRMLAKMVKGNHDEMLIYVLRLDANKWNQFMVEVARFNYVHDVKAMIMAKHGIPIDQQGLIYQGKHLEDGHTLGYYKIENESVIHLIHNNISVRQFDGNNWDEFMVEVAWSDTVHDVKAMIMDKHGIPIHQQLLIYQGYELEDGQTLAYYKMDNESIIHLILCNPTEVC